MIDPRHIYLGRCMLANRNSSERRMVIKMRIVLYLIKTAVLVSDSRRRNVRVKHCAGASFSVPPCNTFENQINEVNFILRVAHTETYVRICVIFECSFNLECKAND